MHASTQTWTAPTRRHLPYEATVTTALPAAGGEWDAVHDAALDSFPASDAPSWSALRIGPPAGGPVARASD